MKILIVTLSIILGLFLPFKSFNSLAFVLVSVLMLFFLGLILPYLINLNTLSNKIDRTNVTFRSNISIFKSNTISYWFGIFVCFGSIINLLKHLILIGKTSELAIFILVFGLGLLLSLSKVKKSLKL